jgi:F-type H+-transporting ATPase subunit gamma
MTASSTSATLFYSRVQVGDRADPDRAAADPGADPGAADAAGAAPLRIRAGEGEILADLLPRNISVQIFRALLENAGVERARR